MPPDTLSRVVMRVGESRKRGVSFVNGQFGFGMQAFRAACTSLTVLSRSESPAGSKATSPAAYQIRVDRHESSGFKLQLVSGDALERSPLAAASGTVVTLAGFDPHWVD